MVNCTCISSRPLIERKLQDFMPNREDNAVNLSVLVEFCITGESLVHMRVELNLVSPLLKEQKYYLLFK